MIVPRDRKAAGNEATKIKVAALSQKAFQPAMGVRHPEYFFPEADVTFRVCHWHPHHLRSAFLELTISSSGGKDIFSGS
jgi:hypothetical protein